MMADAAHKEVFLTVGTRCPELVGNEMEIGHLVAFHLRFQSRTVLQNFRGLVRRSPKSSFMCPDHT